MQGYKGDRQTDRQTDTQHTQPYMRNITSETNCLRCNFLHNFAK